MAMLIKTARLLRKTVERVVAPSSVKTSGGFRRPLREREVFTFDFNLENSPSVNRNIESSGTFQAA